MPLISLNQGNCSWKIIESLSKYTKHLLDYHRNLLHIPVPPLPHEEERGKLQFTRRRLLWNARQKARSSADAARPFSAPRPAPHSFLCLRVAYWRKGRGGPGTQGCARPPRLVTSRRDAGERVLAARAWLNTDWW